METIVLHKIVRKVVQPGKSIENGLPFFHVKRGVVGISYVCILRLIYVQHKDVAYLKHLAVLDFSEWCLKLLKSIDFERKEKKTYCNDAKFPHKLTSKSHGDEKQKRRNVFATLTSLFTPVRSNCPV